MYTHFTWNMVQNIFAKIKNLEKDHINRRLLSTYVMPEQKMQHLILDQIYPQHMRQKINQRQVINQYKQNLSKKDVTNE